MVSISGIVHREDINVDSKRVKVNEMIQLMAEASALNGSRLHLNAKGSSLLAVQFIKGAIHSTKISGNFGPKLNGSVRSNRKSLEKTGPPFEVNHFSRSHRLEFWLNGSRPKFLRSGSDKFNQSRKGFRSPAIQRLGKLLMKLGN